MVPCFGRLKVAGMPLFSEEICLNPLHGKENRTHGHESEKTLQSGEK